MGLKRRSGGGTPVPSLPTATYVDLGLVGPSGSRSIWEDCITCGDPIDISQPYGWTTGQGDYAHHPICPMGSTGYDDEEKEDEIEQGVYQVTLANSNTWSHKRGVVSSTHDGILEITDEDDGSTLAVFAPGAWTSVIWVADTEINEA